MDTFANNGSNNKTSAGSGSNSADLADLLSRIRSLEMKDQRLYKVIGTLWAALSTLEDRLELLEKTAARTPAPEAPSTNQKKTAEGKPKKPSLYSKSAILLDIQPLDDQTDLGKLEELVRSVQADGLLWGASSLTRAKTLQIACVVEDAVVETETLVDQISAFKDHVQSVDVVAAAPFFERNGQHRGSPGFHPVAGPSPTS